MGNWSPFVKPEVNTVSLPHGHWVTFKKRLTVLEKREIQDQLYGVHKADGSVKPNYKMLGIGEMAMYVVDWSFRDEAGAPIKPTLESIGDWGETDFEILEKALDTHKEAMKAEDDARKNARDGESESTKTSPS